MKRIRVGNTGIDVSFPDEYSDDDVQQRLRQMFSVTSQNLYSKPSLENVPNSARSGEDRMLDQAGDWVSDSLQDIGFTKQGARSYGQAVSIGGELAPGTGHAQAAQDMAMYSDKGDYFNSGLAAMGMLPGGALVKKTVKKAKSVLDDLDFPTVNVNIGRPSLLSGSKRIGTTGKYKGAPDVIKSPQSLGNMRGSLYEMLEEGMVGRAWYDNSSEFGRNVTGGRPGHSQRFALMNAQTSQGASVPANQSFGVRGHNQSVTGANIDTGRFPSAVNRMADQLPSGEVSIGPKVGPFYEALTVRPGDAATRPTNDLWMARAFGYKKPDGSDWDGGLSDAQHRFMDSEMGALVEKANKEKLGGFDDWTPEKVQASVWTSIKSRSEGTSVEKAAYDFADEMDRLTGNINVESEPALGLNHLPGLRENTDAMDDLHEAQRALMSDENGRDLLSLSAGGLTRPTETGFGAYKGYSAPADVIQTMAAPGAGSNVLDPASDNVLKGVAAAHGLLRGQESVGYGFFKAGGRVLERNAADVDLGRVLDKKEMVSLSDKADEIFDGAIFPVNRKNGVTFLTDPDGLNDWAKSRGIKGDDTVLAKAWQKELNTLVKTELDAKPTWGVNSGDLVGSWEEFTPSSYIKTIDESGVGEGLDPMMRVLAEPLNEIDGALKDIYPKIGERSKILAKVRQTLASDGLDGIRKLVDKGIVPVAVLTVLAGGAYSQLSDPLLKINGQNEL